VLLAQLSYARSTRNGHIAQVFAIFFQAVGVPTRGFELLHQLGLSFTQRWSELAIGTLSDENMRRLMARILNQEFFLSGDNVNIPHRVSSQRIYNQNQFESGVAVTAFLTKKRPFPARVGIEYRHKAAEHGTITLTDLVDPNALSRGIARKRYYVIDILLKSPYMVKFSHRNDRRLEQPPPLRQAPLDKMDAFILKTMPIDQASYEGNVEWLMEALSQMGLTQSLEAKKKLASEAVITVVGDELTSKRLKGLKIFRARDDNGLERLEFLNESVGWFHVLMLLGQEIWQVHAGTTTTSGLLRDVRHLERIHFSAGRGNAKKPEQPGIAAPDKRPAAPHEEDSESSSLEEESQQPSKPNLGSTPKKAKTISFHDIDEAITQCL
jgi:hypothetical protein